MSTSSPSDLNHGGQGRRAPQGGINPSAATAVSGVTRRSFSQRAKDSKSLKQIDMYGYPFELKYNGDTVFKTAQGGFITLLTVVIFTLCIWVKLDSLQDHSVTIGNGENLNIDAVNSELQKLTVGNEARRLSSDARRRLQNYEKSKQAEMVYEDDDEDKDDPLMNPEFDITSIKYNDTDGEFGDIEIEEDVSASDETKTTETNTTEETPSIPDSFYSENNFRFMESREERIDPTEFTEPVNIFKNGIDKVTVIFNKENWRRTQEKGQINDETDAYYAKKAAKKTAQWIKNYNTDIRGDVNKYLALKQETVYIAGDASKEKKPSEIEDFNRFNFINRHDGSISSKMKIQDLLQPYERYDIKDDIYVMGDYQSTDFDKMKAYTKFSVKLNFQQLQYEALERYEEYLEGMDDYYAYYYNGGVREVEDCIDAGYSNSWYYMNDTVLQQYVATYGEIADEEFFLEWIQFRQTLKEAAEAWRYTKFSNHNYHDFMSFQIYMDKRLRTCNNVVKYGTYVDSTYDNYYKMDSYIREVEDELYDYMAQRDGYLDSIVLQVTETGSNAPITLTMDKPDFYCFDYAIKSLAGYTYIYCYKQVNVINFQLNKNYVQDVFKFSSKADEIQPVQFKDQTVTVKGHSKIFNNMQVNAPLWQTTWDNDFDSLWSCIFVLDSDVKVNKEVWWVWDKNELRTSILMQLSQRANMLPDFKSLASSMGINGPFDVLDFIAYACGLWLFITRCVFAPYVKKAISSKFHRNEIGNEIFFEKNSEAAALQKSAERKQALVQKVEDQLAEYSMNVEQRPNTRQSQNQSVDQSVNSTMRNLMRMGDSQVMDSFDLNHDSSAVDVIPEVTEKDCATLEDQVQF